MKLAIICVGKIKEQYLQRGIEQCSKKIRKLHSLDIIELADEKTPDGASEKEERRIKEKEGDKILEKIKEEDYVIAMCLEGTAVLSHEWEKRIRYAGERRCVIVIGGSLGLSQQVIKRANDKISISRMTFPHQLIRYMLLEQLEKLS